MAGKEHVDFLILFLFTHFVHLIRVNLSYLLILFVQLHKIQFEPQIWNSFMSKTDFLTINR